MLRFSFVALLSAVTLVTSAQDFLSDSLPLFRFGDFAVADYDGDGLEDIFGYQAFFNAPSRPALQRNVGDPFRSFAEVDLGTTISVIGNPVTADFDGDDDPDVASVRADGMIVFFINDGGSFTIDSSANLPGAECLLTGDLNGDGTPDLLSVSLDQNTMTALINNGGGNWTATTVIDNEAGLEYFFLTDIDNDGDLDPLAIYEEGGDRIVAYLNDGTGNYTRTVSSFATSFPDFAEIGDFNGDGLPDIYYLRRFQFRMDLLINDGDLNFTRISEIVSASPRAVLPGDFNGDGLEDFAVGTNDGGIQWYENLGTSTPSVARREVGFIAPAFELAAIDLENDGDTDILGSNLEFHYFINQIPQIINGVFNHPTVLPLEFFPNPAVDQVTLLNVPDGSYRYRLTDMFGRIVQNSPLQGQNISLAGLPSGQYALVLTDKAGRLLRSAMVEKH